MRICWFGDLVNGPHGGPSGFGRIGNEVTTRLRMRGHEIHGASIMTDGMFAHNLPFWVSPLAGRDIWGAITHIVGTLKPDAVVCCQDFNYAETLLRACRIDWSQTALVIITPIDGEPVKNSWVDLVDDADATLIISRFGVNALRKRGKRVGLCHPGINQAEFYPADADERAAIRTQAGFAPDDFVLGMFAMNQGRKNIPGTLQGFHEFSKDKPNARIHMDMERIGAGGFDILEVAADIGIAKERFTFKGDLEAKGLTLRQRYCLLDAHSVLSFREGFGLPLLESMACGVATLAQDYCSGTEIVGEGRGVLIPTLKYGRYGTWGGAKDFDPDIDAYITALNRLYAEPGYRAHVAETGLTWARQQTWDNATEAVAAALQAAVKKHKQQWRDVDAASLNHHSGLQPTGAVAAMPEQPDGNYSAGNGGNHPDRRLFNGVQPIGNDGAAVQPVQGNARTDESRIRGGVQLGGDTVSGPDIVFSQLRYAGASELVAADARNNGDGQGSD